MQGRARIIAAFAGLALAAGLASCGAAEAPPAAERPAMTVTVEPVRLEATPHTVTADGTVAAWEEAPVGAETGGLTAVAVYTDEGRWVRQGQPLVKLNDELLSAQLRQADAQVASARARMAEADAALGRARELHQRGYLSQAGLDQAVAGQQTAAAAVQAAQAQRAEVAARLAQTVVRAPVSGLITARSVLKGQIVSPGAELFRLVREGRLELNAQIPETELARIRAGMTAAVVADESGRVVTGRVRVVTPQVDPRTRLGVARIALPGDAGGLRPGMFARAAIDTGARPAVVIPAKSVVYREGRAAVFVVDAESRARLVRVSVGTREGDRVEILEGLAEGRRVVVDGAGFLMDGDRVAVAARPATEAQVRAPAKAG